MLFQQSIFWRVWKWSETVSDESFVCTHTRQGNAKRIVKLLASSYFPAKKTVGECVDRYVMADLLDSHTEAIDVSHSVSPTLGLLVASILLFEGLHKTHNLQSLWLLLANS